MSVAIQDRLMAAALSTDRTQLKEELRELKNSVIGNVLRKVQVAEDGELLKLLMDSLDWTKIQQSVPALTVDESLLQLEVINETAVILGSLANVGHLSLAPLLLAHLPARLLELITVISSTPTLHPRHESYIQSKLLPSLLRALRNICCSAADAIWGHMWGVGVERRVVGTGLVGYGSGATAPSNPAGKSKGKCKEPDSQEGLWRPEAKQVLSLVFEQNNLDALLGLLAVDDSSASSHKAANPQILLPLFQLLAHLVALPSHRRTVAAWPTPSSRAPVSSLLNHLLLTISQPTSGLRSSAAAGNKLQIAALDLLASLVKDEPVVADVVRQWRRPDEDGELFMDALWTLVRGKEAGVRVAAAACLTNIMRIPSTSGKFVAPSRQHQQVDLLKIMPSLLVETLVEDRIRAGFVLSNLIKDQSYLQEVAEEEKCPHILISRVTSLAKGTEDDEISEELRARYMESLMLALAALAFHHEPTRALIANAQPSLLDVMLNMLSHESYGVRAATCQLARALSRSVAILRTNLMDSGVGNGILDVLKRETESRAHPKSSDGDVEMGNVEDNLSLRADEGDERAWTVEVAATATICNLVTDFSPMQTNLIETGGIELLAGLTKSEHEPLRLNALWALKNMTFHAPDEVKVKVMDALGWQELANLLSVETPLPLREQALDIVRNLVADAAPAEVGKVADNIGYDTLLHSLQLAVKCRVSGLQAPALWVLSNLALGPEKLRAAIATRHPLMEGISEALSERSDDIKVPAIMCLRHLIEINGKNLRPRPGMVTLLQPYHLVTRLSELAAASPSLDVVQASCALLAILDKAT